MYTFIAYKPNLSNYSSRFIAENQLTEEQLIKEWSNVLFINSQRGCDNEDDARYEIKIYENGNQIWNEYATFDAPEEEYTVEEYDTIVEKINEIHNKAEQIAKQLETTHKAKEQEKERKKVEADKIKAEAERKQQYEKLKLEFEKGN